MKISMSAFANANFSVASNAMQKPDSKASLNTGKSKSNKYANYLAYLASKCNLTHTSQAKS